MGESQQRGTTSSRTRNTIGGRGEIVEVQGGHIVRSTGRKDRHSKVCTAKGTRDRRVRLSAHTAIQFYDVQDRLGYDRPSKAVDWLIKKAKAAIDELEELPAWNPTSDVDATAGKTSSEQGQMGDEGDYQLAIENLDPVGGSSSGDTTMAAAATTTMHQQQHLSQNPNSSSSFLPPALDSDAIADTIKSFFPIGATAGTTVSSSPSIQFQNYPPDLLSRTSSQSQDLRLSLQLFQEPILLQHHHQRQHHGHAQNEQQAALLSETTAHHGHFGFDGSSSSTGWSEQQPADISRYQRMVAWNAGDTGSASGGGGGFIFNTVPPSLPQPLFGQNQLFTQRGTLQSSNTPSIRAWMDPALMTSEHHIYHQQSASSASAFGGFTGFRVPARIQGEEEEHDGIHNRPSSAYSDSGH